MYVDILKQLQIFQGIADDELRNICKVATPTYAEFKKDDILLEQEDFWECFGIVKSGYLKDMRYSIDAKTQLLRSHGPLSIINLEGASTKRKTSPTDIKATTDGSLLWFSFDILIKSDEIPISVREIFFSNVIAFISDDSIRFMNKLYVMSWRRTWDRVMAFMLILKRKRKDDIINLGMTQEEFAQYLCVDRTTLTDTLNKMKHEGLIDYQRQKKDAIYKVNFSEILFCFTLSCH
jgi:CRP-like cAMP-binding protein